MYSHPKINQLILELKKEKTSFFQRSNIDRKLKVLNEISKIGTAEDIRDLLPFVVHENRFFREKTVDTIEILLNKIKSKNDTYHQLRYCSISLKDLDTYQSFYNTKHLTPLLIIASMNKNGFIREQAIKRFNKYQNPKAIQYILFRLGDWVKPVRETAKITLDCFLTLEYFEEFIDQLSIIKWLLKVKRTNLEIEHKKVLDFLTVDHLDCFLKIFPKQKEKNRLILAKHILKREKVEYKVIQVFIKDKNFLIRKLVAENIEKFYTKELKETLFKDKTDRVRLHTLYPLLKMNKITTNEWRSFLIDKSFWIRDLARFELRHENIDFIAFYKKQIAQEAYLNIAILGLGEVEKTTDVESLKEYLHHKNKLVRQSAAISILKMDEYAIDDYLIQKLNSDDECLKKIAINHLSKHPDNETLDKIRAIYDKSKPVNKISILKLFSKISSNRIYPDLLKGLEEENEGVREIASKYLMHWNRQNSNRVFD